MLRIVHLLCEQFQTVIFLGQGNHGFPEFILRGFHQILSLGRLGSAEVVQFGHDLVFVRLDVFQGGGVRDDVVVDGLRWEK